MGNCAPGQRTHFPVPAVKHRRPAAVRIASRLLRRIIGGISLIKVIFRVDEFLRGVRFEIFARSIVSHYPIVMLGREFDDEVDGFAPAAVNSGFGVC